MSALRYAVSIVVILVLASVARWLLAPELYLIDPFLVATVFVGLYRSAMTSQLYGVITGLTQDFFGAVIIGINGLSKAILGYSVASLKQTVLINSWFPQAITFLLATLVDEAVVLGIRTVFGLPYFLDPLALSLRSFGNALLGLVLVLTLGRRMAKREKGEAYEVP